MKTYNNFRTEIMSDLCTYQIVKNVLNFDTEIIVVIQCPSINDSMLQYIPIDLYSLYEIMVKDVYTYNITIEQIFYEVIKLTIFGKIYENIKNIME